MLIPEPEIYYFAGEGLIAQIFVDDIPKLYTREGILHRLLIAAQHDWDAAQENRALELLDQLSIAVPQRDNVYQLDLLAVAA